MKPRINRIMRRTPGPGSGSAQHPPPFSLGSPRWPRSDPSRWAGIFLFLWKSLELEVRGLTFFKKNKTIFLNASTIKGCRFLAKLRGAMTALLFLISLRSTASCLCGDTPGRMKGCWRTTAHIYLFRKTTPDGRWHGGSSSLSSTWSFGIVTHFYAD